MLKQKSDGWGELFRNDINYDGKWIQGIIQEISALLIIHKKTTKHIPNGIHIGSSNIRYYNMAGGFLSEEAEPPKLGIEIDKFIVGSYITKRVLRYNPEPDEKFTTLNTINIVLNGINKNSSLINKEVINNIITILNHPHFKGCNNVNDIQDKIQSVAYLNNRFKGVSDSSEEEEEKKELVMDFPKTDPRHPDFFFD